MVESFGPEVGAPDEQPFDASDETQVNNRRRSASRRKAEERKFLKELLENPAGRNWMWGLLEFTRAFEASFVAGDPFATHFNDGVRNVGLRLLSELGEVAPDALVRMMKERGKA